MSAQWGAENKESRWLSSKEIGLKVFPPRSFNKVSLKFRLHFLNNELFCCAASALCRALIFFLARQYRVFFWNLRWRLSLCNCICASAGFSIFGEKQMKFYSSDKRDTVKHIIETYFLSLFETIRANQCTGVLFLTTLELKHVGCRSFRKWGDQWRHQCSCGLANDDSWIDQDL